MYLIDGIICGMVLSLPFGPLAIYCMEKTMSEGRMKGWVSSLGMITTDVVYSIVALLGFKYVETALMRYQWEIKLISGILILGLGYKIFRNKNKIEDVVEESHYGYLKSYVTTTMVALANPLSIFTFIALYALLGVSTNGSYVGFKIGVGVILGGGTQWLVVTGLLSKFRAKITLETIAKLRHYASMVIMMGGVLISLSALI